MKFRITPADLQIIQHEADIAARRLIRKLCLPSDDHADIRQELLVDLIARLPAFDPSPARIAILAQVVQIDKIQVTQFAERGVVVVNRMRLRERGVDAAKQF